MEKAIQARLQAEQSDSAELQRERTSQYQAQKRAQEEAQAKARDQIRDRADRAPAGSYGSPVLDAKGEAEKVVGQTAISQMESSKQAVPSSDPGLLVTAVRENRERRQRAPSRAPAVSPAYESPVDAVDPVGIKTGEKAIKEAESSQPAVRSREPGILNKALSRADVAITGAQTGLSSRGQTMETEALKSRSEGQHIRGVAQITGAQLLRAGSGFVGGVSFPLNPLAWVRSARDIETLVVDPSARQSLVTGIMASPHGAIAEIGGSVLGGMAFGAGAEAVIKQVKGPTSSIEKMRRSTRRTTTRIRGTKAGMKESFQEIPGASVVDDFSLSQYRVGGDGTWPTSGSGGFGKKVYGRTGSGMSQILVPEGTPSSPIFKLVKQRGLTRRVPTVKRVGPGPLYKYSRTTIPATSPGLTLPGGALGLMSGDLSRTRAGDMTQESMGSIVNMKEYTDLINRMRQDSSPGARETPGPQRGDVIQGGWTIQEPKEVWDITNKPGPDPIQAPDPQKTRTRTIIRQEPILFQDPKPIPDEPRPSSTWTPPPRRRPGKSKEPGLRLTPLMRMRKKGLWDPMGLKLGLKTFNVKKAREVV